MTIHPPTKATLAKYGMSEADWLRLARSQNGACGACGQIPISGRLNIDHEHIRGWKKMPPDERKGYVRGLLCYMCNSMYCSRGMTVAKAEGVAKYLTRYGEWKRYSTHLLGAK